MGLTTTSIYTTYTVPIGTNTSLNPVVISVPGNDGLAFDFVIVTSSTSPGPNAAIQFYYAYSLTGSYTGTAIPTTVGFSRSNILLRVPSTVSTTIDVTPPTIAPIIGNYLYCWLDTQNFLATATLSATAVGISL